jgi:outer membrane protein assembly factor BamB
MNKILVLTLGLSLLISGCNKLGSSKITQLIDFTPALEVDREASNIKVVLDQATSTNSWHNHINSVNQEPRNIKLNINVEKLVSDKLRGGKTNIPPIIAEDKIFVLDNKAFVSAYDSSSLKKLWSVNISPFGNKKEFPGGGLVYNNGKIAVTGGSRDVVVLNAQDGTELFRKTLGDIIKTQPILEGDNLIVLTVSNILYAINIKSGSTLWQHEALPEVLASGKYVSPILYKDKVIVTYSSGSVFLINARSGEQEWGLNLAAESNEILGFAPLNVEVQPIIEGNNLYVASNSGYLFKIVISTGEILWKKSIQDIKSVTLCGNMLYLVTNAKQFAAVNKDSGIIKWVLSLRTEKDVKNAKPVSFSNIILINNIIHFTTSDGQLFKIDPTQGQLIDKTLIASGVISQAVAGNRYYIFTVNSNIIRSAN